MGIVDGSFLTRTFLPGPNLHRTYDDRKAFCEFVDSAEAFSESPSNMLFARAAMNGFEVATRLKSGRLRRGRYATQTAIIVLKWQKMPLYMSP